VTRTSPTRSRKTKPRPADLKLSSEVAWYLDDRGWPLPTCLPKFKTPEPRKLRGAMFDPARVDRVIAALERMQHTQAEWAGRPLRPDPWQVAYILAPVYGWVRKNDRGRWVRVARTAYVDIPRKNGKTTLAGGQALYLTGADGEAGAQVLAAAGGKDQASFCFAPVKALADGSPALKAHFRTLQGKVLHPRSGSYFMVVSSIADLLHGANVHGAVIDELHIHKTRDLVDAIETGTGARSQPLIVIITTPDDSRQGTIYDEKRRYCEQLAAGTITDPRFYGVIFGADETDDPFDEATWIKANPGYGISPTREFMEAEARKAQQSPANRARFLRLHLGLRTKQETKYLELAAWDANAGIVDEADLVGRTCFGGLDLASTSDLCALAWDFPDADGRHTVLWRHWCPETAFERLNQRTAGQAAVWRRDGRLTVTPGNVADYDYIRAQINTDRERFRVRSIGYDPWNSSQLVNDLVADDAPMVQHRQGFASMSPPTKEMQRLILEQAGRYRHGGNPLVRWQVDNFAVEMDPAGNVKPSKRHAGDKIDGIVAGIVALDEATRAEPAQTPPAAPRRAAAAPTDLTTIGF
jgi:phage terminase large subunit-like protein